MTSTSRSARSLASDTLRVTGANGPSLRRPTGRPSTSAATSLASKLPGPPTGDPKGKPGIKFGSSHVVDHGPENISSPDGALYMVAGGCLSAVATENCNDFHGFLATASSSRVHRASTRRSQTLLMTRATENFTAAAELVGFGSKARIHPERSSGRCHNDMASDSQGLLVQRHGADHARVGKHWAVRQITFFKQRQSQAPSSS